MLIPLASNAQSVKDEILSPSSKEIARVSNNSPLVITLQLSLPLTPPPGVQQAKAWKGWSVSLSRKADIPLGDAASELVYSARLLRIRPGNQNEYYVLTAIPLPWMPDGLYDLTVKGPGIVHTQVGAVLKGNKSELHKSNMGFVRRGDTGIVISNRSSDKWSGQIDIVVSGTESGLIVKDKDGNRVPLVGASWATSAFFVKAKVQQPYPSRVLRYAVVVPGRTADGPGMVYLQLEKTVAKKRDVKILLGEENGLVRPVDWQALTLRASFEPVSVLWDYMDGEYGSGKSVRHRWMFVSSIHAWAAAFDSFGVAHRAVLKKNFSSLRPVKGCSCNTIGGDDPLVPATRLVQYLSFFLE